MLPVELTELLLNRLEREGMGLDEIDKEIWHKFGTKRAVLISDMSGFSKQTKQYGIIHFLSLIAKRYEIVQPIINQHQGYIVKAEADNLFIAFNDSFQALQASMNIHKAFYEYNQQVDEKFKIEVCHGLDQGDVLYLENDFFGDAVNIASKLGEDVSEPFETLFTENIFRVCTEHSDFEPRQFTTHQMKISDVEINYFKWTFNR